MQRNHMQELISWKVWAPLRVVPQPMVGGHSEGGLPESKKPKPLEEAKAQQQAAQAMGVANSVQQLQAKPPHSDAQSTLGSCPAGTRRKERGKKCSNAMQLLTPQRESSLGDGCPPVPWCIS